MYACLSATTFTVGMCVYVRGANITILRQQKHNTLTLANFPFCSSLNTARLCSECAINSLNYRFYLSVFLTPMISSFVRMSERKSCWCVLLYLFVRLAFQMIFAATTEHLIHHYTHTHTHAERGNNCISCFSPHAWSNTYLHFLRRISNG